MSRFLSADGTVVDEKLEEKKLDVAKTVLTEFLKKHVGNKYYGQVCSILDNIDFYYFDLDDRTFKSEAELGSHFVEKYNFFEDYEGRDMTARRIQAAFVNNLVDSKFGKNPDDIFGGNVMRRGLEIRDCCFFSTRASNISKYNLLLQRSASKFVYEDGNYVQKMGLNRVGERSTLNGILSQYLAREVNKFSLENGYPSIGENRQTRAPADMFIKLFEPLFKQNLGAFIDSYFGDDLKPLYEIYGKDKLNSLQDDFVALAHNFDGLGSIKNSQTYKNGVVRGYEIFFELDDNKSEEERKQIFIDKAKKEGLTKYNINENLFDSLSQISKKVELLQEIAQEKAI